MLEKDFWYIAAESKELTAGKTLARVILDEWIVLFRGPDGQVVCLQDRCLHRQSQLSPGRVENGVLICPYHGWHYDQSGEVIKVPSEGGPGRKRCAQSFSTIEQDDFIYVRLSPTPSLETKPFSMPCYKSKGYTTIRLQNRFANTVTNCAENFVDIPHTTFVHPTIFRNAKNDKMGALIERKQGIVTVTYQDEKSDFGLFAWFLNPKKQVIRHTDQFLMPNITSVNYWFGESKHFIITSQSVPVDKTTTLVYTDLTYNYGWFNWISRPLVRWQGQAIIDQDITILDIQGKTIRKYGAEFQNSPSDMIHIFIESIQGEIAAGRDPRLLPEKEARIEFWV